MLETRKEISGIEEWKNHWEKNKWENPGIKWETAVEVLNFKINMRRPYIEGSDLPEHYSIILPISGKCIHHYGHPNIGPFPRQECDIDDVRRCPIAKEAIGLYLEVLEERGYIPLDVRQIRNFMEYLKSNEDIPSP